MKIHILAEQKKDNISMKDGEIILGFQQKCTPCGQLVVNKEENVVIEKKVLILRLLIEQGKDELRNKRIRRRGWRKCKK